MACLLSGGLDSSLVTALVNEFHKDISIDPLETYSIGLEGSEDLRHAKIVADYLGTKHTEIVLKEEDFIGAINEVIYAIESYDTTTVRASIGNYLLGKYIAENSNAKVIFNGDGSDELCGGYLYMHACPDEIEFDKESRRLLKDIHAFDVLRSDKCISSHGLEPRTPFLDRSWVQYYLSIHPSVRFHSKNNLCEKHLLRTAFSKKYFKNSDEEALLPDEIIWRTKEAFSDGVSKNTHSLYAIIQDYILANIESEKKIDKNIKISKPDIEKKYYKFLFDSHYKDTDNIIPYYWMPKYVNARDASARTLDIYSKLQKKEDNVVIQKEAEVESKEKNEN
jgi:asparagine synthase (glutamine-hydrolysing)